MTEDFSIASARQKLDNFKDQLEKLVPNPGANRLLDLNREYTPDELRSLLQQFGSYISSLAAVVGQIEAEHLIVSEGLKTGMEIAMEQMELKGTTITQRKAELMANDSRFADLRKLEIMNEAMLALVRGWLKSYESAYASVSRIITLFIGETTVQSGRYN